MPCSIRDRLGTDTHAPGHQLAPFCTHSSKNSYRMVCTTLQCTLCALTHGCDAIMANVSSVPNNPALRTLPRFWHSGRDVFYKIMYRRVYHGGLATQREPLMLCTFGPVGNLTGWMADGMIHTLVMYRSLAITRKSHVTLVSKLRAKLSGSRH